MEIKQSCRPGTVGTRARDSPCGISKVARGVPATSVQANAENETVGLPSINVDGEKINFVEGEVQQRLTYNYPFIASRKADRATRNWCSSSSPPNRARSSLPNDRVHSGTAISHFADSTPVIRMRATDPPKWRTKSVRAFAVQTNAVFAEQSANQTKRESHAIGKDFSLDSCAPRRGAIARSRGAVGKTH
jgi:hypothetical protein